MLQLKRDKYNIPVGIVANRVNAFGHARKSSVQQQQQHTGEEDAVVGETINHAVPSHPIGPRVGKHA